VRLDGAAGGMLMFLEVDICTCLSARKTGKLGNSQDRELPIRSQVPCLPHACVVHMSGAS